MKCKLLSIALLSLAVNPTFAEDDCFCGSSFSMPGDQPDSLQQAASARHQHWWFLNGKHIPENIQFGDGNMLMNIVLDVDFDPVIQFRQHEPRLCYDLRNNNSTFTKKSFATVDDVAFDVVQFCDDDDWHYIRPVSFAGNQKLITNFLKSTLTAVVNLNDYDYVFSRLGFKRVYNLVLQQSKTAKHTISY